MADPKAIAEENLRVLIVEDNPFDAELIAFELRNAGFEFRFHLANDRASYLKDLAESCPDIILSDYDLPSFTGAEALEIKKAHCPEVPFILVTGAVGEERAIEILTGGATDYVLKKNLSRLVPAFQRALQEAEEHKKRTRAEAERDALFKELERRVQERTSSLQAEIDKRAAVEGRLRESENRVRMKLESILNPAGDIGSLELIDIIDQKSIQSLLDDFYKFGRVPIVIEDLSGNILVSVGWQDICAKFHRVHPETCRHCRESDTRLSSGIPPGEFRLYKCKNNMWDMATPIVIGGHHMGNFFTGQFIFEDEQRDYDLFRSQAEKYGFNPDEYLKAYEMVPKLTREYADTVMTFLMKFADMISKLSFSNVKLARTLTQYDSLLGKLSQSRAELRRAQAVAKTGSWRIDVRSGELYWSEETYRIFGIPPGSAVTYDNFLNVVHPDDRAYVDQKWKQALEGIPYDIEHRIMINGEVRWIRERAELDFDEEGKIVYGFGTAQDITDRRRTEEALRESEEQFRAIFELTGIGMTQTDPMTGKLLMVNDTLAKMLGFEREELIGKSFLDLTYPDDREESWNDYLRLVRGDINLYDVEKRYVRKDGSIIWCMTIVVLIRDVAGNPLRAIAAVHDITERKRTEGILQESEERFRLAQQAGKVGIFDWDLEKGICIMSEELAKMYGIPADFRPTTREWLDLVHPEDRRAAYARVLKALSEKRQEIENEYRIQPQNGRIRWLSNYGRIYYDSNGRPVRMIGTSVDVTERKLSEIALKDAEEKLRLAVESTDLGTFDMDPRTYKLDWSVNSKLQFGLPPDAEVDYDTFLRGIHPEDRGRIDQLVQHTFQDPNIGLYSTEFRTIGIQDGKLRWLASWGRVFFDVKGQAVRFIGVSADITDLKRAEQMLKARTAELEELNRELESFSYSVSHDLRAPLRTIKGYSRIILDQFSTSMEGDMRSNFDLIVNSAAKMERLIDDLLSFSRMSRGKLTKSDFEMRDLVSESWREVMQLNPGRKVDFRIQDLPPAFGDRNIIKQVWVNLLSNSVKFTRTRTDPLIEIGGTREGNDCVFFIRDNGVGFDMRYHSKLFGVFQRLHGAEYEGTGVGLAIVQRIIHRHGGRAWAKSEPDKGATFYFSLPNLKSRRD